MSGVSNKVPVIAVVLSAGKGKRMQSDLPKVLHPLHGKPIILHVYDSIRKAGIDQIVFVVGHKRELVQKAIVDYAGVEGVSFAIQDPQNGTGHAVMVAEDFLSYDDSWIFIALGDVPLLRPETITGAISHIEEQNSDALVITTHLNDPSGYGRMLRDHTGKLKCIREQKDCTSEELKINEINTGVFIFRRKTLFKYLKKINKNNAQREYYLTDLVELFYKEGLEISTFEKQNPLEFTGVNSRGHLQDLEKLLEKGTFEGAFV